ncbi:hypothetical protein VNI00_010952 [Paramarasmius palmivorus]|uniref:ABM domain-containing protein n=1 Tax=Paramarasmius palmivorus TaxID=297713 RepID=A0AAW0CC03_9AGAR
MVNIVEVVSFPASQLYLDDPQKFANDAYKMMHVVPGYYLAFNGVEVENKETGWVFVGWESVEHHARMPQHPNGPDILAQWSQVCPGEANFIVHVETDGNFKPFEQPALELVSIKLKNIEDKEKLEDLLRMINARHAGKLTWGSVKEEEGAYKIFNGWQSVEAHLEAAKQSKPEDVADIKALAELADFAYCHVKLHVPERA